MLTIRRKMILEVVVAVLLFVGLIAFLALIYASMRTLFAQAAHTIAFIVGHASNIFHSTRPLPSDTNRPSSVFQAKSQMLKINDRHSLFE